MKALVSPKELAAAIGVSESTVKRWVDDGVIPASRTVGGHRRIAMADAVQYIRHNQPQLIQPAAIGLSDLSEGSLPVGPVDADALFDAMHSGDGPRVRGSLIAAYLAGHSIAKLCDGPVTVAMHRMGEIWRHDPAGVFYEHRAVDLCVQAISLLRLTIARPASDQPIAVGGAGPGDPYLLPSLMATTVLADVGFRDINLGPNTPIATLLEAVRRCKPSLVWISLSSIENPDQLANQIREALDELVVLRTSLIIGGRASDQLRLPPHPALHRCTSMAELEAFARGVKSRVEATMASTSLPSPAPHL